MIIVQKIFDCSRHCLRPYNIFKPVYRRVGQVHFLLVHQVGMHMGVQTSDLSFSIMLLDHS